MKKRNCSIGTVAAGGEPKLTMRIIRRCNFRCPLCSTFSSPERRGRMRSADFKTAVDILAEKQFRGVLNISGGEPVLHPRLPEMIAYAAGRLEGASIVVFTNGYWLGSRAWRKRLRRLLAGPNVLIRFSLDRQHAEGAAHASGGFVEEKRIRQIERERLKKAHLFAQACLAEGALPGTNFDFAFKGSMKEARKYTLDLGEVPLYLITFRKNPRNRPKEFGFFALDVDENNEVLVYPTLGHIPAGEPLGRLEALAATLQMNRDALKREE